MPETARHQFLVWVQGMAQIDVVYNDLLRQLEAKLCCSVKSRSTDAQPGSPSDGDLYIITSTPSGAAWSGFAENSIAWFSDGTWYEQVPIAGWLAMVEDEGGDLVGFNGSTWVLQTTTLPQDKLDATVDPNADNDIDEGYTVGSRWINVTADTAWVCLNNTDGAAVWKETTIAGLVNKFDATSDPDADNDVDEGYTVGSRWVNTSSGSAFTCVDNTDGAAVWVSATGLNQSQVDARVEAVAGDSLNGFTIRKAVLDDEVWEIDLGYQAFPGNLIVTTNSGASADAGGVFSIRMGASATCWMLAGSSNFVAATGALDETTATDGKITVATHSDNIIRIINRVGGGRGISVTVNAAPTAL